MQEYVPSHYQKNNIKCADFRFTDTLGKEQHITIPATAIALRCDVLDPNTMLGYVRDPRSVANRAELYLQSMGVCRLMLWWL